MYKSCLAVFGGLLILLTVSLGARGRLKGLPDGNQSLTSMSNSIRVLQIKYAKKNKAAAAKLQEISNYIHEMQANILLRLNQDEPEQYIQNLASIAKLLKTLAEKHIAKNDLLKKLDQTASDLALKVAYSRSSRGEPYAQIEAVIRTVKESNEISGYEVWYVPVALDEYRDEYRRFDNLSSPAVMLLPPGNYFLWATKGIYISERRPLTLGNDGRSKRRYDLDVK
jgi:hypothetical protein